MPKKNDMTDNEDHIDCKKITNIEIEEWMITTRKVLIVLDDENKNAYNKVYQEFIFDLQRLKNAERITDIDYKEILESL
ncbi:MAG: hypothetical protein ACD_37C00524G0001 [uncultured bacterium]|nr:MAG: hypothetical protein ACD_37C00524G0001 [uncultured bacterium]